MAIQITCDSCSEVIGNNVKEGNLNYLNALSRKIDEVVILIKKGDVHFHNKECIDTFLQDNVKE